MKLILTFILLCFFSFQTIYGQDTTARINMAWTNLKTQLQRRTDIVSNLTSILSKSTKVDKEQLNNSKVFSIDLFKYVDTLSFKDSVTISLASTKNNKLTQALARTLATLENDKKLRSDNELQVLLMQLEGCENRIALAKQEYNDLCKEYGKTDLLFGSDNEEKAPEVKFGQQNERTTKVFAKAGLDNVTSAMCKHQQWFGHDVQFSALVLNFNNIFLNGHLYQADELGIPCLRKYSNVGSNA